MTVDYKFYTESYGGTELTESVWKRLSGKAAQRLSHFTFDRIPKDWEDMPWSNQAKCAVCEMAEFLLMQEKGNGKTSENTDGYSISYSSDAESDGKLYEIVHVYLGNTGLMDFGEVEIC